MVILEVMIHTICRRIFSSLHLQQCVTVGVVLRKLNCIPESVSQTVVSHDVLSGILLIREC